MDFQQFVLQHAASERRVTDTRRTWVCRPKRSAPPPTPLVSPASGEQEPTGHEPPRGVAPAPLANVPQPAEPPNWFPTDTSIKDVIQRKQSRQRDYWFYLEEPTDRLKQAWLANYRKQIAASLEEQILQDEEELEESSSDEPRPLQKVAKQLAPRKPNNNKKRARTLSITLQGDYNELKPKLEQLRDEDELTEYRFRRVLAKYLKDK